jgi:predicted CXXCH cytochrome family protein
VLRWRKVGLPKLPKIRGLTGRPRLGLALVLGTVLVSVVALAVSAQAEILPFGTSSDTTDGSTGSIKTHTNAGVPGVEIPFSLPCNSCHVTHKAENQNLLQAEGVAICARCHDLSTAHSDPATQQSLAEWPTPGDCLSCHTHASGFMPISGATSLMLDAQVTGYDDLDNDGNLSPEDRVHYRIDYWNNAPDEVAGVLLRDELDSAHVASVEAISDEGTFDETTFEIHWDIGTLAGGASGYVTFDAVLRDAEAFGGSPTTTTQTAPPTTGTTSTTESPPTTDEGHVTSTTGDDSEAHRTTTSGDEGHDRITTTEGGDQGYSLTATGTTEAPAATPTETTTAATTTTTLATTSAAAGSVDVVNMAVLTADDRDPVYSSVFVSVVVDGSDSTTSTTLTRPTGWATTTTARSTTSTTLVAGPRDVVNTAVLRADDREPVFAWVIVSVVLNAPPAAKSPTTSAGDDTVPFSDQAANGDDGHDRAGVGDTSGGAAEQVDGDARGHGARRSLDRSHYRADNGDDHEDLKLSKQPLGYDDLDDSGNLSPGDRVHYRIDYANNGRDDLTGAVLGDELNEAKVASVEAIAAGGAFDETTFCIWWDLGTLEAGASGFVTYDVVLRGVQAFGGSAPAKSVPSSTETTSTTGNPTTTGSLTTTTTTEATGENSTSTSIDPSTTESPTITEPAAPETGTTTVPLAVLAAFPLAGAAGRRLSRLLLRRNKACRRHPRPSRRDQGGSLP